MPFPAGVTQVTVTGEVSGVPDGQPVTVKFVAADWAVGPAANALWPAFTRYAVVAADGTFSIDLPATDDPAWTPVDWSYAVTLTYGDTSVTGTLTVPYAGGTFDLADRIDLGGTVTAGVTYMPLSLRSAAGGVAGLDVDGDVIDAAGNKIGAGGAIPETIVNAKGDLIAATAADTVARLAVGTNGQYLTAASGQATGLQWDTFTATDISDSTTTGRAVVTAADAAAGRTAIGAMATTGGAGFSLANGGVVAEAGASRMDAGFSGTVDGAGLELYKDDHSTRPGGASFVYGAGSPGVGSVRFVHYDGVDYYVRAECLPDGGVKVGNSAAPATPTGGGVLYVESGALKYINPSGGITVLDGVGGSSLVVKRAVVSSGNITPQNTAGAWAALTGGPTLAIPAAVGDYISIEILALLMTKDSATFYDLAVLNGASLVRFGSSGTGTPATEGDGSLYHDTAFPRTGTVFDFVAESGDINGGNVTACFAVKSAGAGTFHAGFYPFRWRVLNHGAATVS
jgi:hypothetical protein